MTPQAAYNKKQRALGGARIYVEFRANEPEAQAWNDLVQWFGTPKKALSELIKQGRKSA